MGMGRSRVHDAVGMMNDDEVIDPIYVEQNPIQKKNILLSCICYDLYS